MRHCILNGRKWLWTEVKDLSAFIGCFFESWLPELHTNLWRIVEKTRQLAKKWIPMQVWDPPRGTSHRPIDRRNGAVLVIVFPFKSVIEEGLVNWLDRCVLGVVLLNLYNKHRYRDEYIDMFSFILSSTFISSHSFFLTFSWRTFIFLHDKI